VCFTKILLMPILLLENNCKIILFIKALIKWHGISLSQMTMYMLQMTWNISVTNDHVYVINGMEYLCHKWPCICYKWHGISLSQMTMYMSQMTWNISVTNDHVYVTNDMEYLCDKWPCICYKWYGISLWQMTMYMLQMTWNISVTNDHVYYEFSLLHIFSLVIQPWMSADIMNLVCYTYFHWFFSPECQHIFRKQTGYIFQSPKTIKIWTTKHYASLNQWYNTE
jgi:hypothetical protein